MKISDSKSKTQKKNYDWQKVSWSTEDFAEYKKICLASLEDNNLLNFYKCFNARLNLVLFNPSNLDETLRREDCLLIYSNDIFPTCNKLSVHELWDKLFKKKIDNLMRFCYVSEEISLIKESDLSVCKLIQKFDDGAFSVAVVDGEKHFVGTITRDNLRKNFPAKNFEMQSDLFLSAEKDEAEIKRAMAEIFFETGIREIPIVQNRRVLSFCRLGKTFMLKNREENFPPVYWDAISDDVAKAFLEGKRRILISSTLGSLKGFRERFEILADISVCDEPAEKLLNEDFDFLVYGADVWENFPTIKFSAQKLYANLFAEEIRRYFEEHGVEYFYLEAPKKFEHKNKYRTEYSRRMATAPLTFGSPEEDYLIHSDKFDRGWNTAGGIRHTPGVPQNFCKQIFLFGACSVIGTFVEDESAIAAFLQKKFNETSAKYRVVNCGNNGGFSGATINELYRMGDTHFNGGDIVIHVNSDAWCYAFSENLRHKFSFDDVFNRTGNKFSRPFRDTKSGHHLNAKGNELIADFLFHKLLAFPFSEKSVSDDVLPFFSVTPIADRLVKNLQLKNFLATLKKEKVSVKTAGAIVMNCNPFTLGHRYLIERARSEVDFLYVFVVEEDCSEFSFRDRFFLAKLGCADLSNVKILPTGKYIISLITFADYFQKEALQGQMVTAPIADIKLFGQTVAPLLGIKKRFVGAEPFDSLTAEYNHAMRNLLPNFGVELIEVARHTTKDGEIISASTVRNLIKRNKLEDCQKFLPATTWNFIKKSFERKVNISHNN